MSNAPADSLHPVAFWFLRHGETDWNAQNLSQGNVDIPLNETGLAQARSAALLLRAGRVFAAGPLGDVLTPRTLTETFNVPLAVHRFGDRWAARLLG